MKPRHRKAAHRLYLRAYLTNAGLWAEAEGDAAEVILGVMRRMLQLSYGVTRLPGPRQTKALIKADRRTLPLALRLWSPEHFLLNTFH